MLKDLRRAAIASFVLVLPFALLELRLNTLNSRNALDYIVLFGLLWLLPAVFIVILMPVTRALRGEEIKAKAVNVVFRIVCLGVIATLWGRLLIDQLPCFFGVPNCD